MCSQSFTRSSTHHKRRRMTLRTPAPQRCRSFQQEIEKPRVISIQQSHQTKRRPPSPRRSKLACVDDQSYIQKWRPIIPIQLPIHLPDVDYVENLEPTPLQKSTPGFSMTGHTYTLQLKQIAAEWQKEPLNRTHRLQERMRHGRGQQHLEGSTRKGRLRDLYDKKRASVHADVKSKQFNLERGSKQGDLLSTLFKALLQSIVKVSSKK